MKLREDFDLSEDNKLISCLKTLRIKYLISIINIIDERKDREILIDELTKKGYLFY